jgi:hypothetical protein
MDSPNPVLMRYYGNEELYQKKLASAPPNVPEDMRSLASIAAYAGADLAKSAGIVGSVVGGLAKSPLARKVVGAGALIGGGLLAAKAIKTVPKMLGSETAPKPFGSGHLAYNPAGSINSYGQPDVGSPVV